MNNNKIIILLGLLGFIVMAFCFMGGGGIGTALGGKIATAHGLPSLFLIYGVITLCLSFFLIKTPGLAPLPVMQAEHQSGN